MCVAGLLMTSRNINLNIMQDHLTMLWQPGHGMVVEDLRDKCYLFRFNHRRDLRWVIDNRPWTFDNALLVLPEVKKGETPTSRFITLLDTNPCIAITFLQRAARCSP
ncbi:hypothetical protein LINGRAHAP2_LOCUS3866 [Linum grandiflorum]